ncbi:hypothetical protein BJF92_05645 [Rhizobium rhizosphaerae]|uniref:Fimbrial protein n=1 Tax=Xaviernesmea rhizosphaerae TaxID=1672749 RepID=A0A1Q9AFI9_9HYPH|nr:hypothetical protein [Xaviernesmea rhizosphaerae]OLP53636.1 hypothetical protein BJF92_05645 [Xaviernesmea rhizosphaerae]OQP86353.1 hypothetical protein BTR14_11790 [Xaviernesmea rhizosphaerae]
MSLQQEQDEQEDKPLDPAMESVRRKMMRLQLVSGGIMMVMFMAVLGAIVYKVTRPPAGAPVENLDAAAIPAGVPVEAVAALPAGFAIDQVALSGRQILFYGRDGAGTRQAIVFDYAAGRILATVRIAP